MGLTEKMSLSDKLQSHFPITGANAASNNAQVRFFTVALLWLKLMVPFVSLFSIGLPFSSIVFN